MRQDNKTLPYEKCSECPLGMYSLKKGEGCLLCPMSTSICFRDVILIPPGYWRSSNDDDVIYFCKNNIKQCLGSLNNLGTDHIYDINYC